METKEDQGFIYYLVYLSHDEKSINYKLLTNQEYSRLLSSGVALPPETYILLKGSIKIHRYLSSGRLGTLRPDIRYFMDDIRNIIELHNIEEVVKY